MTANSICESIALKRWLSKKIRLRLIKSLCPGFMQNHDFETGFFGYRYPGNTRNLIDRKVLFSGCHECDALAFIKDYLANLQQPVCLDIGANVGHHALFMSRHASRVFAFEPYAPVRRLLEEKLLLNEVTNVEISDIALGAENASMPFFSPPEGNLGIGSFVKDFSEVNVAAGELEVKRLDDLTGTLGLEKLDFIKLDVEGFEKDTLTGSREALKKFRPVVLFESSIRLENSMHSVHEIQGLFPADYRFYRFTHRGKRRHGKYLLVPLTQDLMEQKTELTILAAPVERAVPMASANRIAL